MGLQIPDVSEFKGKEFVFQDDFLNTDCNVTYPKGLRFRITKIKSGWITFKVISALEECMGGIQRFADNLTRHYQGDIAPCQRAVELWEKDPDGFAVIPKGEDFHHGLEHPLHVEGKVGYDVYTRAYSRIDGEMNPKDPRFNVWYNKEWYDKSLECILYHQQRYAAFSKTTIKEIYLRHYKGGHHSFSIAVMNSAKFAPVPQPQ